MNKRFKRASALVLALVMALSALYVNVYADEDAAPDENYLYQKQLLEELGILNFDVKSPDSPVNRGQFADMAMRTYSDELQPTESAHTFSDVIPNYEFKDAVEAAYASGIFKGTESGIFGVNETITVKAAVTVMFRILGYEQYVEWQGDFDGNCMTVAGKTGLVNQVDLSKDELNFKNAVQLIYNAIDIAPLKLESVSDGSSTYNKDKNETLISERLGIYKLDGTVTDNPYASLLGAARTDKGYVKIDGKLYSDKTDIAADFIGMNVSIYYKDKDGAIPQILHIEDDNSDVTKIDDESYCGFSDGKISYMKSNGSKRYVSVGAQTVILYNGSLVQGGEYDKSLFDITNGTISVIENSVNGLTVVCIWSYTDVICDRVVTTDESSLIIDKFDPSRNVHITDEDLFDVRGSDGAVIGIEDISGGSVVSAALSLDGTGGRLVTGMPAVKQAYVTSLSADGATVKTFSETDHTYFETEYKFSEAFKALVKNKIKIEPSKEYTVYINAFGDAAYMDLEKDVSDFYAYIIGTAFENKSFNDSLKLKVFKTDGKVAVYKVSDNVKIDGISCRSKSGTEILGLIGFENDKKSKLVYLSLTFDSEIISIDTCPDATAEREADYSLYKTDREADNTLYKIDGITTTSGNSTQLPTPQYKYFMSTSNSFDTGIFVNANTTKIMAIPLDSTDENRYKILTTASFVNGRWYRVEGYSRSDDEIAAEIVVFFYYSRYSGNPSDGYTSGSRTYAAFPFGKTGDTDTAYVNSLGKGKNPDTGDTEDVLSLTVLRTGSTAVHYIDDPSLIEGISQGDVVRWYTLGGTLCYLEKLYNVNDREFELEKESGGALSDHGRTLAWSGGSTLIASYWAWPNEDGAKCEYITDSFTGRDPEVKAGGYPQSQYMLAHGVITQATPTHFSFITYDKYKNGKTGVENRYNAVGSSAKFYKYDERSNTLVKTDLNSVISYGEGDLNNTEAVILYKNLMCQAVIIYQ